MLVDLENNYKVHCVDSHSLEREKPTGILGFFRRLKEKEEYLNFVSCE